MKRIFFFFFVSAFYSCIVLAQTESWTASPDTKRFIENKSQFDGKDKLPGLPAGQAGSKILFGIDQNGTQIFFTKQGLTYRFDVKQKKDKEETESEQANRKKKLTAEAWAAREKEERSVKIETDMVRMQWENSDPNAELIAEDKTDDYFSYTNSEGKNINYIGGYQKLVYKNIYPNIDVEYVFHPQEGIKYSIILHPGADVSQVKMNYSNAKKIFSDKSGNIHISTLFGDIIDHAPVSYYENHESVSSKFQLTGNSVAFKINPTSNIQHPTSIIIDPWVQTPTLTNSNGVWECERDGAGNVYIIGGDSPMKLLKYNSSGTIQWTYSTPYDTANDWLGTFATDLAGNSYVTSGSIAAMQKINTNAGLVWNFPAPTQSTDEYWSLAFNCDQTELIAGGTSGTGAPFNLYGCIFEINTNNGVIINKKQVRFMFNNPPPYINEARSITSSPNGGTYYLTLDTTGCINSLSFNSIFNVSSGYGFAYKCENFRPNNGNAGVKAIKANGNFVYTQNGSNIQKRSLITGSVLGSAAIPGGVSITAYGGKYQAGNSGIDIDSCGNVYVGSANSIIKYDANLNLLTSLSLPFAVYDVAVNKNGEVVVAGATGTNASTSRTGYVQSINMGACASMDTLCIDSLAVSAPNYSISAGWNLILENTSNNYINGTLIAPENSELQVGVIDLQGKIIRQNKFFATQGANSIKMDVSGIADGLYLLKITGDKLHGVIIKKFIKR